MDESQPITSGNCDSRDEDPKALVGLPTTNRQITALRAIRCSKESPCAYCIHARLECSHTDNKPKEKRARILITTQYEKKIDQIDRRLNAVVQLIQDLSIAPSTSSARDGYGSFTKGKSQSGSTLPFTPRQSTSSSTPSHILRPDFEVAACVESDSSLAAHSEFASEFLQRVLRTDSMQDSSLNLEDTLNALSQIMKALKQQSVTGSVAYPHANRIYQPHLQKLELPPIDKSVLVIRAAESKKPFMVIVRELGFNDDILYVPGRRISGMAWVYDFLPSRCFPDLCLEVYFSTSYSEYDFITVNGGLYSLFIDYAAQLSADERGEYYQYARTCRENLETSLANLRLHTPAESNVIVALLFGTFYAVEISKPSLAWTLCSKASELCQTLSYHQVESLDSHESLQDKPKPTVHGMHLHQFLFWNVYCIDKSLSLRLGRASTIQDRHVTMPEPSLAEPIESPVLPYLVLWIRTARCQGQIHELLYSPESRAQPPYVRQMRVDELVCMVNEIEIQRQETNDKYRARANELAEEHWIEFHLSSNYVMHLTLLTQIHRAAPRAEGSHTTFNSECVKAARAALEKHRDCDAVMRKFYDIYLAIYFNWTIIIAPFVPFIVVFCQVIETQDTQDLARLHSFVIFLQETSTLSEAAAMTHRLFRILYSVALRFVEFRTVTPQFTQAQASAELDAHLASLGFPVGCTSDGRQQPQSSTEFDRNAKMRTGSTHIVDIMSISQDEVTHSLRAGDMMMRMTSATQMEDFLYNNQAMIEILQGSNLGQSI
ncbi:fungal specific transcription factor domain-containing protein [Colletotrichum tofieldiae]|uniref:Fungal specific transcription factor domain-containing protein n=1 Tax=Colletotrichum tofieldiae TaxID=708197 RepID=A0A166RJH0_9PEZI|nr:fungal specific transcription factor domain-containing protein [Colletotrichum tofieldiae]